MAARTVAGAGPHRPTWSATLHSTTDHLDLYSLVNYLIVLFFRLCLSPELASCSLPCNSPWPTYHPGFIYLLLPGSLSLSLDFSALPLLSFNQTSPRWMMALLSQDQLQVSSKWGGLPDHSRIQLALGVCWFCLPFLH